MTQPYRLLTIPPSHYCEKARWALELAGIDYREERHPPLFHVPAVKKARGIRTTPVLVAGDEVLPDSTDILQFLQTLEEARWRPYPADPQLRLETEELEELFDTRLGPHTRRLAYFYLMQHRHLFVGSVLAGVEGAANSIFKIIAPGVAFLMRRGMNINAESAERSLGYVRESFAEVSELLSDGRTHLVGTQLTAADLTFAALAAPMVLPEDYGSPLPSMGELPDELRELVAGFRETPAGEFVLGIYEEYR